MKRSLTRLDVILIIGCIIFLALGGATSARQALESLVYRRMNAIIDTIDEPSERGANSPGLPRHYAGWLRVESTAVDYPVATLDEGLPADYFLTHDVWGNPSIAGSLYFDGRCTTEWRHGVIYGHHIGWSDQMLGSIWCAYKQDTFSGIGCARWLSKTDDEAIFRPICALRVDASYTDIQRFSFASQEELAAFGTDIADQASARAPSWSTLLHRADRLLTLITCTEANGHSKTRTIVLFAHIKEKGDDGDDYSAASSATVPSTPASC